RDCRLGRAGRPAAAPAGRLGPPRGDRRTARSSAACAPGSISCPYRGYKWTLDRRDRRGPSTVEGGVLAVKGGVLAVAGGVAATTARRCRAPLGASGVARRLRAGRRRHTGIDDDAHRA